MPDNLSAKEPQVVISDSLIIRDWSGLVVELEQSGKACKLAIDLLEQIIGSLQVSVQSLSEQAYHDSKLAEYH